jgi:hypothetical protein
LILLNDMTPFPRDEQSMLVSVDKSAAEVFLLVR